MDTEQFEGEIKVASTIVDYLSSGLYQSPAACLKELINNSYDADATEVNVYVKPDADRIIIEDNGHGMNRADFEKHFKMISESHKREESDTTESGRLKIGKIGIGFIAANEICNIMEIVSTKRGSKDLLEVTIDFEIMRMGSDQRKRNGTQIAKADYIGSVGETDEESQYTIVFLKEVRGEAKSILAGVGGSEFYSGKNSLYGLKHESVSKVLKNGKLKTWADLDAYSKNITEIALNVPVRYHEDWVPEKLDDEIGEFVEKVAELNFRLYVDGTEIRKPIVFNPSGDCFISEFSYSGEHVSANGYFYAQHGVIKPQELQGLIIRIRNAAVGDYDPSFLEFSPSIGTLFQTWISAEIMADDRLEDAMNIDRRTLRISHPAYLELQKAVHDHFSNVLKEVRTELYLKKSEVRKKDQAKKIQEKIINIVDTEMPKLSPQITKEIKQSWKKTTESDSGKKILLTKYSVDQLYKILIEVATEVIPSDLLEEFIKALTKRLRE